MAGTEEALLGQETYGQMASAEEAAVKEHYSVMNTVILTSERDM